MPLVTYENLITHDEILQTVAGSKRYDVVVERCTTWQDTLYASQPSTLRNYR